MKMPMTWLQWSKVRSKNNTSPGTYYVVSGGGGGGGQTEPRLPPCKVCGCTAATLVCDACYSRHADSSAAAPAMPKELGDTIPINEMVTRLEKRGAELNDGAITPNGQLMLKAAFYIKRLASHIDALAEPLSLRAVRENERMACWKIAENERATVPVDKAAWLVAFDIANAIKMRSGGTR